MSLVLGYTTSIAVLSVWSSTSPLPRHGGALLTRCLQLLKFVPLSKHHHIIALLTCDARRLSTARNCISLAASDRLGRVRAIINRNQDRLFNRRLRGNLLFNTARRGCFSPRFLLRKPRVVVLTFLL